MYELFINYCFEVDGEQREKRERHFEPTIKSAIETVADKMERYCVSSRFVGGMRDPETGRGVKYERIRLSAFVWDEAGRTVYSAIVEHPID